MKEREQFVIFDRLKKGEISQIAAAKTLKFTTRWVRKKYPRFLKLGVQGLVHQNRGRSSPRFWDEQEKAFVMSLFEGPFEGFGPTFASQKLQELYGIQVSKECLRKAMIEAGHWQGKQRKPKHRERRERKEFYGQMVQLDGSPHAWLENRGPVCTLISFVDDATSSIPFMMLAPSESNESVFFALRSYIEAHGIPQSIYVDYGAVFSVNTHNPERNKLTQFERACKELGIEVIHARSPQAKGRVERSHGTNQDRLIKELRLAYISTIQDANDFIKNRYLSRYNDRFARPAPKKGDVHAPIADKDLEKIFCIKDVRSVQNDFTLSYKNRTLQLTQHQIAYVRPKELVTIHEKFDGTVHLFIRGYRLNHKELASRPMQLSSGKTIKQTICKKPAPDHPWRKSL